ncbi:MAG: peptide chain release factor N(5)-glutamine methyltransferase [Clostridia bacterium]|nr:peptide chain release factor N(5)-glutamine methyltransferase [Clostridia bacterium]
MNIRQVLEKGSSILKENGIENYYMQARILLCSVLNKPNNYLIINCYQEIEVVEEDLYFENIKSLTEGKPLQYITKSQEFMNLKFYVDENVLIPQPDTETLVEEVLKFAHGRESLKILDLCTGSGAIAITIAKNLGNQNKVYATDISNGALKIARKNAEYHNVKINFMQSDMFENINERFDIIVSNPPYIRNSEIKQLSKQVQNEPHIALDGGKDGLYFYKIIINKVEHYLQKNGLIFLEIGYNQKDDIKKLILNSKKFKYNGCVKDLGGNDRVVWFNKLT